MHKCPGILERKYSSKARAQILGRWPCHASRRIYASHRLKILVWNNQRHLPRKPKMKWSEMKIQTHLRRTTAVRMSWTELVFNNCRRSFSTILQQFFEPQKKIQTFGFNPRFFFHVYAVSWQVSLFCLIIFSFSLFLFSIFRVFAFSLLRFSFFF